MWGRTKSGVGSRESGVVEDAAFGIRDSAFGEVEEGAGCAGGSRELDGGPEAVLRRSCGGILRRAIAIDCPGEAGRRVEEEVGRA